MATNTYVALATQTLGTAASSVTFSSIPQGYTDLVIVISGTQSADNTMSVQFNGDTSSNYSTTRLGGDGSSASSTRWSNTTSAYCFLSFTTQNTSILQIMNYANTTTYKTVLSRSNNAANFLAAWVSLWRKTPEAITSIKLLSYDGTTNFNSGTTFSLYGIAAASVGAKATGGTIYQDASYFYHVFSSSGTFTPSQSISADVLVVAGGGGGGSGNNSGGGGAGGLLGFTSQSLTSGTGYTCTVGAGGPTGNPNGVNGNDSQFSSLTLVKGGGRGGGDFYGTGDVGGSGGGNSYYITTSPASGTSGQGYAGGVGEGTVAPNYYGGGGGGASEAGNTDGIGFGGDGVSTYSSWGVATGIGQNVSGTYFLAGGGGGSGQSSSTPTEGGLGGGGNGAGTSPAVAGLANTGGGGGGSGNSTGSAGKAGGSGVVIVRYAK